MKAIDFVVRTGMGAVQRGQVNANETVTKVSIAGGSEVSLNVRQADLQSFSRVGNNLEIVLADGRVVLLENYYTAGQPASRLFVSADGYLNEVVLVDGQGGTLTAQYGPTEQWGKWSPSDDLIFIDDSPVIAAADAYNGEDEVSMLGLGLLGALGGGSALGIGAAALGGAALLSQVGGGGGNGTTTAGGGGTDTVPGGGGGGLVTPEPIVPTVDDTGPYRLGGDQQVADGLEFGVSGTGEAGSTVTVTVGGETETTTIGSDGIWSVIFNGATIPADGSYVAEVVVVNPAGTQFLLDGPSVVIDTTAPELVFDDGTVSANDITNFDDHRNGVEVGGTGEIGASVTVTVEGETYTTTVGSDGRWGVTIDTSVLGEGEYEADAVIITTDGFGNSMSYAETIAVDTRTFVTMDNSTVEGDGVVNMTEASDGVRITGTTEIGNSVNVTINGVTVPAVVGADGTWHADFSAGQLSDGTWTVLAETTDHAGNVNTAESPLVIDTQTSVTFVASSVEGDGVINFTEIGNGVRLSGTHEPGSTVTLTVAGMAYTADVDGNGNWWLDMTRAQLPEGDVDVSVTAEDAAGNSETVEGTLVVDTAVRNYEILSTYGGADGVVNIEEAANGLAVNGTVEVGSTMTMTYDGRPVPVTVNADGTWTATVPASYLSGNGDTALLSVTATDWAGNVSTLSQNVVVDTDAGYLTLSTQPIEGDDVVNHTESLDGVMIRGTATPGAIVNVQFGTVTLQALADGNGNWTRNFSRTQVPADGENVAINAWTVDSAGNRLDASDSVKIDTVVDNFANTTGLVAGDGIINGQERLDGVTITGTVETGSTVLVRIGTQTLPATVVGGEWTVEFTAADLPEGEDNILMTIIATDRYGNVAETEQWLEYDTLVNQLNSSSAPVEGDNVINIAEAADGVTLTGRVEAGSTVVVTVDNVDYPATVSGTTWTVNLPPEAIPADQAQMDVTITATDAAGNVDSIPQSYALDLTPPDAPDIESYTRTLDGYSAISVANDGDPLAVFEVDHGVPGGRVGGVGEEFRGNIYFDFNPAVPDGSHLIVQATDGAGNTSSTYLVLDETTNSVVDLSNPGLGAFNIEAIDLQFAEDSALTLTEAQIVALSGNTDTLIVNGGADDSLTITGASRTGEKVNINGQMHDVYTLGDSATVMVDDDIQVTY